MIPESEPSPSGQRQHDRPRADEAVCHSGGVVWGRTVTRACRATGETVLVPPIARWDEDGFSSCSTRPCYRPAPNHPAGVADRLVSARPVMLPLPRRRGLGLRNHFLSRPPLGSLALRPDDSLAIPKMALSVGFIRFVSSTDATLATGLLTLTLVGLIPTEHVFFVWTHPFTRTPS